MSATFSDSAENRKEKNRQTNQTKTNRWDRVAMETKTDHRNREENQQFLPNGSHQNREHGIEIRKKKQKEQQISSV